VAVECLQVKGPGVGAERFLAVQVVVVLKVRHDQFPKVSIHRLAKPQAREIGFGYRSPMAIPLKQGQHVVVIAPVRKQVQDQCRIPQPLQKRCSEHSAVETLAGPLAQDPQGSTIDGLGAVIKAIEKKLNLVRCVQTRNEPGLSPGKSLIKKICSRPIFLPPVRLFINTAVALKTGQEMRRR